MIQFLLKKFSNDFFNCNNDEDYQNILNQMKDKKPSGEIDYQCMDFEKVNKYFDWSPSINLDKGMKNTFNWFKDYLSK